MIASACAGAPEAAECDDAHSELQKLQDIPLLYDDGDPSKILSEEERADRTAQYQDFIKKYCR